MGSTYLNLTNKVLRRINEVELTDTSFASARGMQAVVKDAVQDALNEINSQKWEWPYHFIAGSQVLTIGQNEYSWPANFKSVSWDSFQIEKDTLINVNSSSLKYIDINEWYKYMRDRDDDNAPNGISTPQFVFKSESAGFGVTPAPEKAYTVSFSYFKNPTQLSLFSDTTDVPVEFDTVIMFGALYHMNLFRENPEGTSIAQRRFDSGINDMYRSLVGNVPEYVHDTRVNFGGSPFLSNTGAYHT